MGDLEKPPAEPLAPPGGGIAGGISPRRSAPEPPIEEVLTPRERRHQERRRERQERRDERCRARGR